MYAIRSYYAGLHWPVDGGYRGRLPALAPGAGAGPDGRAGRTTMSIAAMLFMGVSIGFVVALAGWCYYLVLTRHRRD